MRRITVTLTESEMTVLQQAALRDTRPTRDQARHILRTALLGTVTEMTTPQPSAENAPAIVAQ